MMRFYPLEKLINLHDNYTRTFKIDALQLLLIQREGERYLLEANCPHRESPLDVASIAGQTITCPLHHYQFSLQDGALLNATEEPCRGLRTFTLIYEGNEVGLMVEEGADGSPLVT